MSDLAEVIRQREELALAQLDVAAAAWDREQNDTNRLAYAAAAFEASAAVLRAHEVLGNE